MDVAVIEEASIACSAFCSPRRRPPKPATPIFVSNSGRPVVSGSVPCGPHNVSAAAAIAFTWRVSGRSRGSTYCAVAPWCTVTRPIFNPSRGSIERSSQPRRQASLRIAASWPRRSWRSLWEKSVFEPLLHRARLLAPREALLEVLLAEHPDRPRRTDVGADRRRLLGVEPGLGLGEDPAGLLFGRRAPEHALPRLALAGRCLKKTWYLLPPGDDA